MTQPTSFAGCRSPITCVRIGSPCNAPGLPLARAARIEKSKLMTPRADRIETGAPRASGRDCPREADRAAARLDGQNGGPGSASLCCSVHCRLNDENSRGKVQNVRADSSATPQRIRVAVQPRECAMFRNRIPVPQLGVPRPRSGPGSVFCGAQAFADWTARTSTSSASVLDEPKEFVTQPSVVLREPVY